MIKLTSIILSLLVVTQSLSLNMTALLQIDELIEHAKFHKAEYDDNIFIFLSKHYGSLKADHEKNHQEEQKEHEQLPFHCHSSTITILIYTFQKAFNYGNDLDFNEEEEREFFYLSSYKYLYDDALLEPPQSA